MLVYGQAIIKDLMMYSNRVKKKTLTDERTYCNLAITFSMSALNVSEDDTHRIVLIPIPGKIISGIPIKDEDEFIFEYPIEIYDETSSFIGKVERSSKMLHDDFDIRFISSSKFITDTISKLDD
jgi:hypothetical protein